MKKSEVFVFSFYWYDYILVKLFYKDFKVFNYRFVIIYGYKLKEFIFYLII